MDAFRIAYLVFGTSICVSGLTMIVTYSRAFPWWRDPIGRMMVVYAGAEVIMSALLTITVVTRSGPHWFRTIWFLLQVVLTFCFIYQTRTILKLKRERETDAGREHV